MIREMHGRFEESPSFSMRCGTGVMSSNVHRRGMSIPVEELDVPRRYHLLQCPPTREPFWPALDSEYLWEGAVGNDRLWTSWRYA